MTQNEQVQAFLTAKNLPSTIDNIVQAIQALNGVSVPVALPDLAKVAAEQDAAIMRLALDKGGKVSDVETVSANKWSLSNGFLVLPSPNRKGIILPLARYQSGADVQAALTQAKGRLKTALTELEDFQAACWPA